MKNAAGLRLPDFIGIGPQRTGTTWLHVALKRHVGLPKRYKEIHFFDHHYSNGLGWYANHFANYPPEFKVGEITPHYFYSPDARTRIAENLPECKIVCTLREPAARMYSVYKLMCHQGQITHPSFERSLDNHRSLMVNHYRYAWDLGLWLRAFDRVQVLVCLYDDFEREPRAYLNRITDFIGIPRIPLTASFSGKRVNSIDGSALRPRLAGVMWRLQRTMRPDRRYQFRRVLKHFGIWQYCFKHGGAFPPAEPELMARLRERFRSDVEELEEILGRDLSTWKDPRRAAEYRLEGGSSAEVSVLLKS